MSTNIKAFLKNPTCYKINCEVEPFWSTLYQDRDTCGWHHSSQHILEFDWDSCPSPEAAIAAVYHDADYDPQRKDNEVNATLRAVKVCEVYFPEVNVEKVVNLISSTRDHVNSFDGDDKDMVWLHKNDLAYLNEESGVKNIINEERIFIEYQQVKFSIYQQERTKILQRMVKHPLVSPSSVRNIIDFLNGWQPSIGIYPGSFNPFHVGHMYILEEARKIFDKVIIAQGQNLSKPPSDYYIYENDKLKVYQKESFTNIFDLINEQKEKCRLTVIRGIRNGGDLSEELVLQTFIRQNTSIPCVNIFTAPELSHVSSGAIRELDKLGVPHKLV
jgi:cytidyltransferase-like protein